MPDETERYEDPGEDITAPSEPLDPETVEKLREQGIEFPDWTPTIPERSAAISPDGPLYSGAPFVPEVIAEDLVFAFKNGWFDLPRVVVTNEASERVTRLWEVKRWAERGARSESRG